MEGQSHTGSNSKINFIKSVFRPRAAVQLLFFLITLYVGIQFYWFVAELEAGASSSVVRPPGVEAFLPISALVSLKYFLCTGVFNRVHPSALVIFFIACTTALIFKKGFCAWVCPVGFLSEMLSRLNGVLIKKTLAFPRWADLILRPAKYLLAGFFIWGIFVNMPVKALEQFIYSPYNRFADLKMLAFFTHISCPSLAVILVLSVLSVFIPHFWCRYLCPYGALLGLLGLLSLGRIRRDPDACINCGKCEVVCPGRIRITAKPRVNTMECSACLKCVDACPKNEVIGFSLAPRLPVSPKGVALAMAALFIVGVSAARYTGYWQNDTPVADYRRYLLERQFPRVPFKGMDAEKMKRMMEMMQKMQEQGRS
ncbi:MAG: 4Fe-4S binding protein [Desulfobacter sp.]|nr:MAG: 4Fe-4S binding protein [Desulfobacter sp.]